MTDEKDARIADLEAEVKRMKDARYDASSAIDLANQWARESGIPDQADDPMQLRDVIDRLWTRWTTMLGEATRYKNEMRDVAAYWKREYEDLSAAALAAGYVASVGRDGLKVEHAPDLAQEVVAVAEPDDKDAVIRSLRRELAEARKGGQVDGKL